MEMITVALILISAVSFMLYFALSDIEDIKKRIIEIERKQNDH